MEILAAIRGISERLGNLDAQVETGDGEGVATDVLSKVLSVAKLVGLSTPIEDPPPAQGGWAGVSMPQSVVSVPAAPDYLLMLKRSWRNPAGQGVADWRQVRLTENQGGLSEVS